MSCVKYLFTKKAYDQKRLEKAIRHSKTSSGAAGAGESTCGNGNGNGSSSATGHGTGDDEDVEVMEVERTELELATEAMVVRAKGTGRQARKELRQTMSRYYSTTLQRYSSTAVQYEGSSCEQNLPYGGRGGLLLSPGCLFRGAHRTPGVDFAINPSALEPLGEVPAVHSSQQRV